MGQYVSVKFCFEFDFSGSQACRALRADGYEVILINSNPATIQNDPEMADRIYIEPLLPEVVKRILEIEKPDALLAGMGGQTALNIASALAHDGSLDELEVELIGCDWYPLTRQKIEIFSNRFVRKYIFPFAKPLLVIRLKQLCRPPILSVVFPF